MRLDPVLARAAAYFLAHYVWSAGVVAASLMYILVPFVVHHHQSPGAQVIGTTLETTLLPSPDPSWVWADPYSPFRTSTQALPPRGPPVEDPLAENSWTGVPLADGILATAFNFFICFVASRGSLIFIAGKSIPVALWGTTW